MDEQFCYEGYWRRLLISEPCAPVDTATHAAWLQGFDLYVDLRQPVGVASRVQASCLAELLPEEARVLAMQEGFAGTFLMEGDIAEWRRSIDFRPPGPQGDRGRLISEGDLLIEHGLEADYIEYWERPAAPTPQPCAGARLRSVGDGRAVYLVQWGRHFAYARDRGVTLAAGADLERLLANADGPAAQALIDCEISSGTITSEGWRIDRSTLPWREGAILLGPHAGWDGSLLRVADVDARGLPFERVLEADEMRGQFQIRFNALTVSTTEQSAAAPAAFRQIPVIDLSAIDSGDDQAERAVVTQLREAASNVGFFHVTGHGIAPAVIERMRAATRCFFDLPIAHKMRSYIGHSTNHRGYVPEGEEVFAQGGKDRKEAFDLALDLPAHLVPDGHPMLGPNQWPELPGFREDVMAYYAAVFALGRRLLHGFAMALGKPADAFDHLVTTPPSQLRLIHYPFDPAAVDVQGIGAHTDYECFTLLLATAPGLEVMNGAGEWIDAPPVENAFVVNIGDMLEYWSGGAFVATSHRVRKVAQERYSFPLFFAVDYDVMLSPLDGRSDAPPIRSGEHIFAQTAQTFRYLKDRCARGEVATPPDPRPLSSFGQETRHRKPSLA